METTLSLAKSDVKMNKYCREETVDISALNYEELTKKVELEISVREKDGWNLIKIKRYISKSYLFPYHCTYTVQKYE